MRVSKDGGELIKTNSIGSLLEIQYDIWGFSQLPETDENILSIWLYIFFPTKYVYNGNEIIKGIVSHELLETTNNLSTCR